MTANRIPNTGEYIDIGGYLYRATAVTYRYEDTGDGQRTVISVEWTAYADPERRHEEGKGNG